MKHAKVLCYDFYSQVCSENRLQRYKTHYVCELSDVNEPSNSTKLEDIYDGNPELEEAALSLYSQLPVYLDSRRDDTLSFENCKDHIWGKLKGLSRKAATLRCTQGSTQEDISCAIDGIIKVQ